jgi:hypothetical protein
MHGQAKCYQIHQRGKQMKRPEIIELMMAVLDKEAPNLDDQLDAALGLVNAVRRKRLQQAQEIMKHLDLKARQKEGSIRL